MNLGSSIAKLSELDSSGIASTAGPILRIAPSFSESSASASRSSPMTDQPSSASTWDVIGAPGPGEGPGGGEREPMELASSWSDSIISDSSSRSP